VTWRAKGTDPKNLWIPEEVGCRLQEDVLSCNSGMVQEEYLQKNYDPRKEVTATRMKITCCAGHRRRRQNEDDIELETPKRTENRRWKYSECNNGIRDKGLKQRLRGNKQMKDPTTNRIEGWSQGKRAPQGIGGTLKKDIYEISSEIMEHVVGTSSRLPKMKNWNLWRGWPPQKQKRKQQIEEEPVN
jgi:hypothetical protein